MKKSAKVEHGFKVTSDGRLIIREDDEEDAKHDGNGNPAVNTTVVHHFMSEHTVTMTYYLSHS